MGYFKENFNLETNSNSLFLKPQDLEKGIRVGFVGVEKVKANDPIYGAKEGDWLYKKGILGLGEQFKFTFFDKTKNREVIFFTKSPVFFISIHNADPNLGDEIYIKKRGQRETTKYEIKIIK